MKHQPTVDVGIFGAPEVRFTLKGIFQASGQPVVSGAYTARLSDGGTAVSWEGRVYPRLEFTPTSPEGDSFDLEDVTIGVDFHWQRKESQRFKGSLLIVPHGGRLWAINRVDAEAYLQSVISSEMKSTSSMPLLKAHAVISRSWLMNMLERRNFFRPAPAPRHERPGEIIRWWDRSDHDIFDVCADDHCQRYQGIGRTSGLAAQAVEETAGLVLEGPDGRLCDTRFSKCCGGVFERFGSCWDDNEEHPCLAPRRDWENPDSFPDLTIEAEASKWIESSPEAFCNTADAAILRQVLNSYDRETPDFYRWSVEYSSDELDSLVRRRLDRDLGHITALTPLERGTSGRIIRLRITGTKGEVVIGKELMIRRTLSDTHLRSSAFTVTRRADGSWLLRGAGWGHGVGLCQIGAAVMGEKGYDYQEILSRYYPDSKLIKIY